MEGAKIYSGELLRRRSVPGVEYSRVGGDLLLRRTAAHERWRWRRSGVEKGGGYLVIDINYFPGYEKLPCYETVMTDFFLNIMKSHTVEKMTADG
ncbi:hypothetical protein L6452_21834 [Arctium lappa]|uniref:Uncharacterized protein n=1 Tax=Arctium lappa TaxID=4217 RepID=A0ACB9AXR3_ARCLA|nr:hypothetical protein L6452_21834 [Arctium lappa]